MVLYTTFPRMTKCHFKSFGTGGHVTEKDYLCVLAPNIISEKIFTFLWFWYCVLAVITVANLVLVIGMAARKSAIRKLYLNRTTWTKKVPFPDSFFANDVDDIVCT
jgi:hypothetical protein